MHLGNDCGLCDFLLQAGEGVTTSEVAEEQTSESESGSELEGYYSKTLTHYGLGLTIDENPEYSALVVGVPPLSPAGKSGIREGSSIVSVDGKRFGTVAEYVDYVGSKDSFEIEVIFEGKKSVHTIRKEEYEYEAWFPEEER